MWILALVLIPAAALIARAFRSKPRPDLTNQAIAAALGRLVRERAVIVQGGYVSTTAAPVAERRTRTPIEARTLAAVRVTGTIPVERLFAAVREARL